MTNTQSKMRYTLIGYKQDYDPNESYETKNYYLTMGGVKSEHKITIADGKSTELMIELTYEKLDDLYD